MASRGHWEVDYSSSMEYGVEGTLMKTSLSEPYSSSATFHHVKVNNLPLISCSAIRYNIPCQPTDESSNRKGKVVLMKQKRELIAHMKQWSFRTTTVLGNFRNHNRALQNNEINCWDVHGTVTELGPTIFHCTTTSTFFSWPPEATMSHRGNEHLQLPSLVLQRLGRSKKGRCRKLN